MTTTPYRRDLASDPHLSFDPASVAPSRLPDPLVLDDATPVSDPETWRTRRRPQLLDAFARHIYGYTPTTAVTTRFNTRLRDENALDGEATRSEIDCVFSTETGELTLRLMLYVPNSAPGPVATFLGFNFWGNHSIHRDPGITLYSGWLPNNPAHHVRDHRATDAGRGTMSRRWPLERIIRRGYAVATACYRDIDCDNSDDQSFTTGIYPLLNTAGPRRRPDQWGSIGAWAWGLSQALDYLATDQAIDHSRIAVFGHSRLGKAALWAAAQDERFAMAISNDSGCGGASLFRHTLGERLHVLARLRPYWFAPAFARFDLNEQALPVDQHQLLALIAPRPLHVASASEDHWADPVGEYLATTAAAPVYSLLGRDVHLPPVQPPPSAPTTGVISYHLRPGPHDLLDEDWRYFLDAADRNLRPTPRAAADT